jgi:hypothetical protein
MKKIVMVVTALLCAVILASCSAAQKAEAPADAAPAAPVPAETAAHGAGEYEAEAYGGAAEGAQPAGEGGLGGLPNIVMPDTEQKLVYSASIQLDTKNYGSDYEAVKQALAGVGGYIENEYTYTNSTDYGSARFSDMTLRVPVDSYNAFLDMVSGIGTVREKQVGAEDISDQYYDTDSRIEILEQRKERLMGHLEDAVKMEDIITLENELDTVLSDLDSLKGSKRGMDKRVDFAQVYLTLNEVVTAEGKRSARRATRWASARGERVQYVRDGVGLFLQDFAVGMAAAAPVLY